MNFRIAAVLLLAFATSLSAQPKGEASRFTIRWYGQAFFTVTTPSGRVIAFEPQVMPEFPRADKLKADVVCVAHPHVDKERVEGAITDANDSKAVRVLRGYKVERPGRPWDWNLIDEKIKLGDAQYRFRTVETIATPKVGKSGARTPVSLLRPRA